MTLIPPKRSLPNNSSAKVGILKSIYPIWCLYLAQKLCIEWQPLWIHVHITYPMSLIYHSAQFSRSFIYPIFSLGIPSVYYNKFLQLIISRGHVQSLYFSYLFPFFLFYLVLLYTNLFLPSCFIISLLPSDYLH